MILHGDEGVDVDRSEASLAARAVEVLGIVALLLALPTLGLSLLISPATWFVGNRLLGSGSPSDLAPASRRSLRVGVRLARLGTALLVLVLGFAGGIAYLIMSGHLRQG